MRGHQQGLVTQQTDRHSDDRSSWGLGVFVVVVVALLSGPVIESVEIKIQEDPTQTGLLGWAHRAS